jgi:hypothetical protein
VITEDYNFEILPTVDSTNGVPFGIGQTVSLDDGGFAPGSTDWAIQDTESSTNGTTSFGRDKLLGPTWSWQLHVNTDDDSNALAALATFRHAWHAMHIRDTPGMVLPIRYRLDGRNRRIYGRPRRFDAPMDNRILSGFIPVSADFKCVDGLHYDDQMTSVSMTLGAELVDPPGVDAGGGWTFPVTLPYDTLPPTQRQHALVILGDSPAQPVIRFNGPVVNPALETDDWKIALNLTIPIGQFVEIDTRPWRMTTLLNGVAGVGGALGRKTRMHKIVLNPGYFEARYSGFSSGTSVCQVSWANTWSSL